MLVLNDLRTSAAFLTRLPLAAPEGASIARASWAFPLVGLAVGALGGLVYELTLFLGLTPFIAAMLAVAATILLTGALHEDGLADTADGFGGGATVERKLEIMRDSRIGTYGVLALIVSFSLKVGAVASLGDPLLAAIALMTAHIAARATLPAFMFAVKPARADGLSAAAGRPPVRSVEIAVVLGVLALGVGLDPIRGVVALLLLLLTGLILARLTLRQIGGQTGDVLGALEQLCEVLILLTASAWL
ncbi:MAG: adenosylcobinamide-GDP ribazoletransferase [Methyloceanibacter sp.]|uniref:adenosylcobinamide-GDP ribazoletransferase n=1 Tax=Methyloceanibacter sp. TaxID=1965321 RepID=UPI003D9B571F